jgi:hypothetical protein
MTIIKANPQKILLAFALIMDKNDGRFDARAVALAYNELKDYLFNDYPILTKREFLKMLNYFYNKSRNKKVKNMPKSKFYKKYFKYLLKNGIINIIKENEKLQKDEIAICFFADRYILINKNLNEFRFFNDID